MLSIASFFIVRVMEHDVTRPNYYSLALVMVALIAGALFWLSWSRRQAPGALLMAWMMAALLIWSGGYALELNGESVAEMLFWARVEYLGIVALPALWLLFALRYTQSESRLARLHPQIFFVIPLLTLLFNYTNEWHHLYYTELRIDQSGPFSVLVKGKGPWYWVNVAYGYLCTLGGSWLLLRYRMGAAHLQRRQAWAIVVGALAPLAGNLLYQLNWMPLAGLDLTPFAFAVSGAVIVWGVYRLRLFDVTPLARDRLIEKLRDGMLVLDAQGNIVDLNPAARRFLALDRGAAGRSVQSVVAAWPGLAEFCSAATGRGVSSRTEITLGRDPVRHLEAECSPLADRRGTYVGSVVVLRDITERKEAEETARARQAAEVAYQAIRQVVDTVEEGLVLLDEDRRVVMTNRAGEAHLRLLTPQDDSAAEGRVDTLGGRTFEEILEPPAGLPFHTLALENGTEERAAGGKALCFEVAIHPLQATKLAGKWLLVTRDITETRRLQQEMEKQERLAAVGQLAAGIAHDFNNVLAVIVLYTGLLQRAGNLAPTQQRHLEVLAQQADHASRLVQQILDFGRKTIVQRSVIDVAAFLGELVELCKRTMPETIRVRLACEPGQHFVLADRNRLQQALMNLAVNGRDAMPEGGELRFELTRLDLRTREKGAGGANGSVPAPGEWVVIRVCDSGMGIDPTAREHIFEPFFTTKQPNKGTGLGLAQVFGIVKQHGGEIEVESEPGQGTTFALYLPPADAEPPVPEETVPGESAPGSISHETTHGETVQRETILVVEDQAAVREAVADSLRQAGYRVLIAEDGAQATELFEREDAEIDLVVSDMVMPGMSGMELYRAMKAKKPSLRMILATGYPLGEDGAGALEQEKVVWLQKPYSADALNEKVRAMLDTASEGSMER